MAATADEPVPVPTQAAAETGGPRPGSAQGAEPPEIEQWRDRWQRAVADAENARKRCDRLVAERTAEERRRVAAVWLPVLDHLDLALRHAEADPQSIVQGVTHVRQEAQAVLTRLGFLPIGEVGERFDPARHEAAEAVEAPDARPGTVVRVDRPGYGGPAGQLRPAVVAVKPEPTRPEAAMAGELGGDTNGDTIPSGTPGESGTQQTGRARAEAGQEEPGRDGG